LEEGASPAHRTRIRASRLNGTTGPVEGSRAPGPAASAFWRRARPQSTWRAGARTQNPRATPPAFLFATGIENSHPTIQGGRVRVDEMEKCGHCEQWRTDFSLVRELAGARDGHPLSALRAADPSQLAGLGEIRLAFRGADFWRAEAAGDHPDHGPVSCGVPDWVGNFQNPDFPALFAAYARDFATRFPWVQLYTPVNEMFICATFSAALGWWNEPMASDQAFVRALHNPGSMTTATACP